MKDALTCDFLVIGAGVIGLCVAREILLRYPAAKLIIIEKENQPGFHASGRNSGVIHAGFYYSANSLKARLTRRGNILLTEFCEEHGLGLLKCGKLVVPTSADEVTMLYELEKRAQVNDVPIQMVDAKEAQEIEPKVKIFGGKALYSPTTSTLNPVAYLQCLAKGLQEKGAKIEYGVTFQGRHNKTVTTSAGSIAAGYVINCAGLYADKIARTFGFSQDYEILPFKGLYLYGDVPQDFVRCHVYPVPNLKNPFLGVHFTKTLDGKTKIGPTAIPALWREQYDWSGRFNAGECFDILRRQASLMLSAGFDFRGLALAELRKYSRQHLVALSTSLLMGVEARDFRTWGKPGIRAQLMHKGKKTLEMDFIVEGDEHSLHVLNSVSPALTCSLPLAQMVVDQAASFSGR